MRLGIPHDIYTQMVARARAEAPVEACGILAGAEGNVRRLYGMTNTDGACDHFLMEPKEQFAVVKDIRSRGLEMLAIYHSHPESPARPSAEDIRLALMPDVIHVIVSLLDDAPAVKGFIIDDAVVTEVPVAVEVPVTTQEGQEMNTLAEPILHIPQTVRQDTVDHRDRVRKFLAGETSPVAFRGYRVPMGIYEQRAAGRFMIRVRIGAALAAPFQLERLAELSEKYGNGTLHVTTRQDIQIHDVGIEETPDVLEGLLEVGLSPRGGGGNTVRNVTACPRAGVCPKEAFDVAPYAIATAEYLLTDRSSFNLPRKYKIAFSGCSEDCAFASVADLAFFAHQEDGIDGFAVYAAGGLGSNPAVAVKIEDFVPSDKVFEVAEAIKRLFDKHGDRGNKHRARLRYVLARVGVDEFIKLYRQEREELQSAGLPYEPPSIRDIASRYAVGEAAQGDVQTQLQVLPDKTAGRVTVRLRLKNGDIPADDLVKVGRIASEYGQGLIRTTQLQDILITGVAGEDVVKVEGELKDLTIDVFGAAGPKVVACAGASTCKLGLCLSRGLSDAITEKFGAGSAAGQADGTVIRISGCPNSCGNHYIPDIGLQGRAKRIGGRLAPYYDVLIGGRTAEGDARLAEVVGSVPARRIPDLLFEASTGGAVEAEQLRRLVSEYGELGEEPLPVAYYYDFGSDELFSLAGRGPGECGAGVMDVIRLDIDEAKDAVKAAPVTSENVYKATVAAARALLVTFGLEPGNDREIFSAFGEHLIGPGWVEDGTQQLLDATIDWRMGDRDALTDLLGQAEQLTERVEELFLSLDASLKFTVASAVEKSPPSEAAETRTVDLCGVECPMNFVKAKLALEQAAVGDVLDILLDEGEPARNAPASLAEQGQEILEVTNMGRHFSVKVRKKK